MVRPIQVIENPVEGNRKRLLARQGHDDTRESVGKQLEKAARKEHADAHVDGDVDGKEDNEGMAIASLMQMSG